MKIVVIGGTGLIGSRVVSRLSDQGHEVVAASPSWGINCLAGEGLAEAMAGSQVVVDVANSPSFDDGLVMGSSTRRHATCWPRKRRRASDITLPFRW